MNYQEILEQVSEYVKYFYQNNDMGKFPYHDKKHTNEVVTRATEIANHYQLDDHDFFIVVAAAWFHDLGYPIDAKHHEEQGAVLAENFLKKHAVPAEDIDAVKRCIMATKMPQNPQSLNERILCDADLFNLGTDTFRDRDKLLRDEYNEWHQDGISKYDWHLKTIHFLEMQHYHTDYAQLLLTETKQKNLEELKDKVAKKEKEKDKDAERDNKKLVKEQKFDDPVQILPTKEPVATASKKSKKDKPEKGIETMFRISSSNHQRLSDMADNKAHIMITVNSIILSAIISLLLRRLSENEYLIIPTCIILTVSLLAMTFAILATRPSLPEGVFTRQDVDNKQVNLLFFGNFYRMSLDDYTYGMAKMMEDRDFLYGSLTRDVYTQGIVLGKKYRLLRISYNIFMFGLIGAVLAFIIASAFFGHK
ncbi:Pycsar system effector family protein [Mucilaginibacter sp. KACC 22063]|uniref:Pycsar system effector family protein n=1 Tax=Mucilaginibacter sp. KACC 22063 TaxID=3025666 RepID=UPI0023669B47|nr:Pycsar system effector family protein [Mucilaginibacter sp. KACC 22063]WDF56766.1 DUF5706 domain-containing protein [Mucilaginibacter sp. KACC 22063]